MSARKSNKLVPVQSEVVEQVEVIEPVVVEEAVVEEVVVEMSQESIDKENRIVDLESEIVKLSEKLAELKKELRMLTKPESNTGPTKMELCIELYKANDKMARKDLVKMFMEQAGLTLAGSRTYCQLIMVKAKAGKL